MSENRFRKSGNNKRTKSGPADSGKDYKKSFSKGFKKNGPGDEKKKISRDTLFAQKRRIDKLVKEPKVSIRLNKFVANSGVCSRREADELIKQGLVTVNGKIVTEMGHQVFPGDKVYFDGQPLSAEKPVYILLNKPKGFISTTNDEKMRKTVLDLVAGATPYRIFPVGRLDRATTGLILLTNDGHLTKKLTHPSFQIKKIYHVTLDKKISGEDMQKILSGVRLEEGVVPVDEISFVDGRPKNEVGVSIHIGWNRVIRRLFHKLGYEVVQLDRVYFAGLTKKNLKRGHWRMLNDLEVTNLKMI